jgi:hypothetical protein
MNDISVIAIFCSDIRQEKGGTETIVGVFPDTVNLPTIPGAFSQMHIYVRMHVRPSYLVSAIITRIVLPDGSELEQSEMNPDLITRTRAKYEAANAPYMGFIVKFGIAPFQVVQEGPLKVIVRVDGVDHIAGQVTFRKIPDRDDTT